MPQYFYEQIKQAALVDFKTSAEVLNDAIKDYDPLPIPLQEVNAFVPLNILNAPA